MRNQHTLWGHFLRFIIGFAGVFLILVIFWEKGKSSPLPSSLPQTDSEHQSIEQETIPHSDEHPLCTIDTYNAGKWIHRPLNITRHDQAAFEKAVGYHCKTKFHHKCYQRKESDWDRNKNIIDYVWEPESCTVLPMEPQQLANHLSEHPILFIGDSITELQYESLMCQLSGHLSKPSKPTNMTGGDVSIKVKEMVYSKATKNSPSVSLAFIRTDYLVRLDDFKMTLPFDEEGQMLGKGHNFPWVHLLPRFDYFVINTGAHWRSSFLWGPEKSQDDLMRKFEAYVEKVLKYLKEHIKPHQRVWLRGLMDGHVQCSQYTKPLETPIEAAAEPYEWNMFVKFNKVFKDWVLEQNDPRFHYLDTSFSNLRADAHSYPDRDCLHTCIPGPVDYWNRLLAHEIFRHSQNL